MSLEGIGVFTLIPAIGLVVLPVAAVAAAGYAGGVVISQAGKGMIACGDAVRKSVQEHLEREQEIARLCKQYEKRVLERARSQKVLITQTKSSQEFTKMVAGLRRQRDEIDKVPQAPIPIVEDSGLIESQPPSAIHTIRDLRKVSREMLGELVELKRAISELDGPEWAGLVSTGDLHQEASEIEEEFEKNQYSSSDRGIRLLRDIRLDLNRLRSEIAMRANAGQESIAQRGQALDLMNEAAVLFTDAADALEENSEAGPALEMAQEMLLSAEKLFRQGKLVGCLTRTQNVIDYLSQISREAKEMRKANTRVAIRALEEYIKGFTVDDPQVLPDAIRKNVGKMTSMIDEANAFLDKDLQICWKIIDEAQSVAKKLASIVEAYYEAGTQQNAANLMQEALGEMKYKIGESSEDADGALSFKATREDGAYFKIQLDQNGHIGYKAENFGTAECQAETKILFDKLREKGVIAQHRSVSNLFDATAGRIREVLLRQGYVVQEEAAEDGSSHTILADKIGAERKTLTLAHNSAENQPDLGVKYTTRPDLSGIYVKAAEAKRRDSRRMKN